jgi:hypothetical protein
VVRTADVLSVAPTDPTHAHVTFVFGDTPSNAAEIVVEASDLSCRLTSNGSSKATRISAECSLGAMPAGAAAAAIALEQ